MIRFSTVYLSVALLSGVGLGCGQVEQPLGDAPASAGEGGVSHSGGAQGVGGGGDTSGQAGRGPSAAAGGAAAATGEAGGVAGCAAAQPTCITRCDIDVLVDEGGLSCVAGSWQCGPGRVDSATCPSGTPGGCAGQVAPACWESCSLQGTVTPECVNGAFQCPGASVDLKTCPVDSCIRTAVCCWPTGKWQYVSCSADGQLNACPAGSAATRDRCLPEGVNVNSCSSLYGQACASTDLVCTDKTSCAASCTCGPDGSGKLVWSCDIPIC
jgi:hypothetical protein